MKHLMLLVMALVSGCSGGEEQPDAASSEAIKTGETLIFQEQIDALDKARQVEQLLQNSNEQQRQLIEEQSH